MTTNVIGFCASAVCCVLTSSGFSAETIVTSNVTTNISQELTSGEHLLIDLYLQGGGSTSGLFGGELNVIVASEDLSIQSISFNTAFSTTLGEETGEESISSNGTIEASQVQALGTLNQSLGADGAPVHF